MSDVEIAAITLGAVAALSVLVLLALWSYLRP